MLELLRFVIKYYVPIVVLFGLVSFFEPTNYAHLPIETAGTERFLTALFEAATFTGEGFSGAWDQYWRWLYPTSSFEGSNSNAIVELLKLFAIGFVLGNLLFSPVYAYGWATEQQRLWVIRYVQMTWRQPRFRTVAFLISLAICAIVFALLISNLPALAALACFFGVYIAFHNPLILNITLSLLDLYGIKASSKTTTFFNGIGSAFGRHFPSPKSAGSQGPRSIVAPPQTVSPPPAAKPNAGPRAKKASWQDRINR